MEFEMTGLVEICSGAILRGPTNTDAALKDPPLVPIGRLGAAVAVTVANVSGAGEGQKTFPRA